MILVFVRMHFIRIFMSWTKIIILMFEAMIFKQILTFVRDTL